ncbi:RNA polymerase sigma factor [Paenibacillus oceani]|uniref:Sigma-70 family RNA polymerase sigma factor n=1 Tax=Paenibacillus oceani TaxID=2772510 RepID=A0A927C7J3_9BACL|nr:sigma-70 family RNA polymerase sigma factor [Paenibacillus oceani]MBD2861447.1 sigma-70 family RNA polymerase sigma factor [Paenibacillus oceani]
MNSNGYADAKEDYLALLQQEYLEKLVYYALKKTGNKHEAEELAQDIAVQAVISLSNGSEPSEFAHWLWKLARNRYARWAERKHRGRLVTAIIDDEQLAEFEDGGPSVEDRLILKENISLLKRELSLLSFYYREITVAYYIRGERVQDIASNLQLPAGTIKRKLYESRKNIREGNLWSRAGELFSHEVYILANAIQSGKPPEQLGDAEKEVIRDLMKRGFVKKGSGPITPTFPVWTREQLHQWVNILKSERLHNELYAIMEEHYDYIYEKDRAACARPTRQSAEVCFSDLPIRFPHGRFALCPETQTDFHPGFYRKQHHRHVHGATRIAR